MKKIIAVVDDDAEPIDEATSEADLYRRVERGIHASLDRQGVPKEGRSVTVTPEDIRVVLPPGFILVDVEGNEEGR